MIWLTVAFGRDHGSEDQFFFIEQTVQPHSVKLLTRTPPNFTVSTLYLGRKWVVQGAAVIHGVHFESQVNARKGLSDAEMLCCGLSHSGRNVIFRHHKRAQQRQTFEASQ